MDSISACTTSDEFCNCHVPVASSLLHLPGIYQNGTGPSQALTPSLFPEYLGSTIHFPLHNEDCKSSLFALVTLLYFNGNLE